MGNRFDLDVLRSFVPRDSSRVVQGVEDLSFGDYLRLLQVPEHWSKLGLKVDSTVVLKRLEQVRTIRNAVDAFSFRFHKRNRSRRPAIDRGVLGFSLAGLTQSSFHPQMLGDGQPWTRTRISPFSNRPAAPTAAPEGERSTN